MSIKANLTFALSGLTMGILGVFLYQSFTSQTHNSTEQNADANEPMYWVAPMDPNFKRDKPGKSPMGMDLVPVFANDNNEGSAGTVQISANVENNLGVKTALVESMTPIHSIRTVGFIQYNEDALVHVHPRTEGWIERLFVASNGDYIEKGAPLYSLYSPELVNAQEEYLLALQQGNKNLILAAQKRLAAMRVPEQVLEQIKKTRIAQQQIIFRAPQSGFIDGLKIREGFYVKPSTTLLAIAGLKEVWVQAEVLARDSAKIVEGQLVQVKSDFIPGKILSGYIDHIYPQVNAQTRAIEARIRLPNPDYTLKPNMFVDISINLNSADQLELAKVLAIPKEALIRTGVQNRVVLALGDGQFKSIEVGLGQIFENSIEILSGLQKGDVVVTSAQFLLDSESSISSDFVRMSPIVANDISNDYDDEKAEMDIPLSGWTQAIINEVMLDERKLNITHGELTPWDMPGMTMDFMVDDEIDMSVLKVGMDIHIEVTQTEMGMFSIMTIHSQESMRNMEGNRHD